MKMQAPKLVTWWIALLLAVLGLLGNLGVVSALAPYAFWLAFFGVVLLAIGAVVDGI